MKKELEGILLKLWGKICLTVTVALGSAILGLKDFPGISLSQSADNVVAHAATTINAESQGMVGNSETANNTALQNILNKWDNEALTIRVPKGTYMFNTGAIKLHSNITFKFDKGAVFQTTSGHQVIFVYPSPKTGYNGGIKNIMWEGASFKGDNTQAGQSFFTQSVHHASNVSFNNCSFYNAEAPTGHYIDLDGSHKISITNSTFTGFNGTQTQDFKEAIQIDYSNINAMSYHNPGDHYDNLPTYDVNVNNNKFLPIYNNSGKIISFAPNPIGEHAIFNNGKAGIIHNIYFTNNTVTDSKPMMKKYDATIRFIDVNKLWIENNKFINHQVSSSGNYICLNNLIANYKMNNLNIKNNTFTNINPNKQYILLNSISPKKAMTRINITRNRVINQKSGIKFVRGNFDLTTNTIKIFNNQNVSTK